MYQVTALRIIQQAAAELGLPVPNSAVTSREATVTQLLALLNTAGYELAHAFEWQQLIRKVTVPTVTGQSDYVLPSDFGKIINQTIWSSDNVDQIDGPLSAQRWELRTEGLLNSGPFTGFRIFGNKLNLNPAPTTVSNITFEYLSNGWVNSYLDPSNYTQTISNDKDVPQFDFMLLVKFLKLKMWQAKGLDTTSLEKDFARLYDMMSSQNKGAPVLSVTHRRLSTTLPLNVPETGYGL